jgi:bifunctional non-homologous end joining protein LigD
MLASSGETRLDDRAFIYEPKYDGIRAIAQISPSPGARLYSRLGNEKTAQFPEIALALRQIAGSLPSSIVLDGEIVALDERGDPAGFQRLQGRIHLSQLDVRSALPAARLAYFAFDILTEGTTDLRRLPLVERRKRLEQLLGSLRSPSVRLSEIAVGDGRRLYKRALTHGWEGLIAKRADSRYLSGRRTPDWRKLKILNEQEFVIGGWTAPRRARQHFGALLLGVHHSSPRSRQSTVEHRRSTVGRSQHPVRGDDRLTPDDSRLTYVGHVGTGFNERELARVINRLLALETSESPFRERPHTNERPHWVRPELVAQVRFTEWTDDGKLRQPVYLGLRDDKNPEEVRREPPKRVNVSAMAAANHIVQNEHRTSRPDNRKRGKPTQALLEELRAIEDGHRDDVLLLPGGDRLSVGNLHKVFWPARKLTKGDLLRYYVQVAAVLLPALDGRPLVMKRFPNGIAGKAFYQQRAPEDVPEGVRVEIVGAGGARPSSSREAEDRLVPRIIGGNLKTLLYVGQLAAISQDPWFSRVHSPEFADCAALDLDPMPGVGFPRVLEVALWIRDELESLGISGVPKTSGADGLHVYVALPPGTPHDAGLIFCQIIATVVATKHPAAATTERAVRARGKRVYIDSLQNIVGKTLASVYSARASTFAGVSTPLTWREVEEGVAREDFTITTVPARLRQVGDLWKPVRTSKGIDLSKVLRYAEGGAHRTAASKKHRR